MFLNADTTKKTAVGRKAQTTIMLAGTAKAVIIILTVDGANPGNVTSHTFIQDDLIKKKF